MPPSLHLQRDGPVKVVLLPERCLLRSEAHTAAARNTLLTQRYSSAALPRVTQDR
jgi:hypothetical protein